MRGRISLAARSAAFCGLALLAPAATAALIGPPVNNTFTGLDSGGQRVNIDQTNPLVLDPGTYTAASFTYFAMATSTSTIPFLVINSDLLTPNPAGDIDQYSVIAVGSTFTTAPLVPNNAPQTVPFGGGANATFTLAVQTKVFAAVSSGNSDVNSIGFFGEGSVDHSNAFSPTFVPAVGGTTQAFTNPDLGRTYGFNIDVGPGVPEPGAAAAVVCLTGGLLVRRRRVQPA